MTPATLKASAITVSQKWAEKLREAGWPQDEESPFLWQCGSENQSRVVSGKFVEVTARYDGTFLAAPTAEEVLRRLPRVIVDEGELFTMVLSPSSLDGWNVSYMHENGEPRCAACVTGYDTLAKAAAAMYVYLAGQKLLPSL